MVWRSMNKPPSAGEMFDTGVGRILVISISMLCPHPELGQGLGVKALRAGRLIQVEWYPGDVWDPVMGEEVDDEDG